MCIRCRSRTQTYADNYTLGGDINTDLILINLNSCCFKLCLYPFSRLPIKKD